MTTKEKIEQLEQEKVSYMGDPCEIYSRVVGYFRPTSAWNDGKKEEYKKRVMYTL